MKDEGLTTDPALSLDAAAVNYLLQRIKVDADLRYLMLHTEAFHRLCVAEAARSGETIDYEKATHGRPRDGDHRKPLIVEMQEAMRTALELFNAAPDGWLRKVRYELERFA